MQRVFVSHAQEDAAYARKLVVRLEGLGFRCWIAPRDVPVGASYPEAIAQGLAAASALALVFSRSADQAAQLRRHILREVELADSHQLPIFPVRVEEVAPSGGLSYFLRTAQWIDDRSKTGRAAETIAEALRARGAASAPIASPARGRWLWPAAAFTGVAAATGLGAVLLTAPAAPSRPAASETRGIAALVAPAPSSAESPSTVAPAAAPVAATQAAAAVPSSPAATVDAPAARPAATAAPPVAPTPPASAVPREPVPTSVAHAAAAAPPGPAVTTHVAASPAQPLRPNEALRAALGDSAGTVRFFRLGDALRTAPPEALSAAEVTELLGDLSVGRTHRRAAFALLLPYLRTPLPSADALGLLTGLDGFAREEVLRMVAPCVARPVSEREVRLMLDGVAPMAAAELDRALRTPGPVAACGTPRSG